MPKLLLVNHKIQNCGVNQFGRNFYGIWNKSNRYQLNYSEHDHPANLYEQLKKGNYEGIILNWHEATLPWFSHKFMNYLHNDGIKTLLIPHDEILAFHEEDLDAILYIDPTLTEDCNKKRFVLGRPLLELTETDKSSRIKPWVGFASFAFAHKGITKILDILNGLPCHIRLHMPPSHWGHNPSYNESIIEFFNKNKSQFQTLEVSRDFLTANGLLKWMNENNLNIFPYEDTKVINKGISSITDFALACRQPFLVSGSNMFRHLAELGDSIRIGKTSPMEAITNGTSIFEPFYERWSIKSNIEKMENIVKQVFGGN